MKNLFLLNMFNSFSRPTFLKAAEESARMYHTRKQTQAAHSINQSFTFGVLMVTVTSRQDIPFSPLGPADRSVPAEITAVFSGSC